MPSTFREPGPDFKEFQYISLGNDVVVFANSGTPTDAVTGAGVAGPGSICLSFTTNFKAYINSGAGTKASPVWKLITSA